ncbi:hypothetical protein C8Q74DRAFT_93579 [Fomes fomentarius]|nr:hypothetical protein C8Q74DRAFT_93579 [Fomes fomentarius]
MLDFPYNPFTSTERSSVALLFSFSLPAPWTVCCTPVVNQTNPRIALEMEPLSCFLTLLALLLSSPATASPLSRRAGTSFSNDFDPEEEEDGPDGHLNAPWVVAVAVVSAIIIAGVAAIVLFLKWRQRRRARQSVYNRAPDERLTAGVREQQYAWKGPYVSRTSFNRSPSPPAPAHLSEKAKWTPPLR